MVKEEEEVMPDETYAVASDGLVNGVCSACGLNAWAFANMVESLRADMAREIGEENQRLQFDVTEWQEQCERLSVEAAQVSVDLDTAQAKIERQARALSEALAQNERFDKRYRDAEAENERQAEQIAALRKYVRHHWGCAESQGSCTCGLDQVLARLDAAPAEARE
jgi:chromosome segregation ATPase